VRTIRPDEGGRTSMDERTREGQKNEGRTRGPGKDEKTR